MKDYKPALISIALNPQGLRNNLHIISHPEVLAHQERVFSSKTKDEIAPEAALKIIQDMKLSNAQTTDLETGSLYGFLEQAAIEAKKITDRDSSRTRKRLSIGNFDTKITYDRFEENTKKSESSEQIDVFQNFLQTHLANDDRFMENIFGQHCIEGFDNQYLQEKNSHLEENENPMVITSYSESHHSLDLEKYLSENKPEKDISPPGDDGKKRFLDLYMPNNLRVNLDKNGIIDFFEVTNSYFLGPPGTIFPVIATVTTEIELDTNDRYRRDIVGATKIKSLDSVLKIIPNPIYEAHIEREKTLNPEGFQALKQTEKENLKKLSKFLNIVSQDSPKTFFEKIFGIRDKTQEFESSLLKIIEKPQEISFFQKIVNFLNEGFKLAFPDYQYSSNLNKREQSQDSEEKISKKEERFLIKVLKIAFPDYKNFPKIDISLTSQEPKKTPPKKPQLLKDTRNFPPSKPTEGTKITRVNNIREM